jgi:hypothetical protein
LACCQQIDKSPAVIIFSTQIVFLILTTFYIINLHQKLSHCYGLVRFIVIFVDKDKNSSITSFQFLLFSNQVTFSIKCYGFYSSKLDGPPLWSSGQSSWLQIRRPAFDSRHYHEKKVVGLERGPFNLMSTTEELLDRKVAAPV